MIDIDEQEIVACSDYTDASLVWQAAGWQVFTHDYDGDRVKAVDCVHAATGKILRFGLDKRYEPSWPEKVLMTLIKMSEEKI